MKLFMLLAILLQQLLIGNNPNLSQPELSEEQALKLRAEGLLHLSTFMDGGNACEQGERITPVNKRGYYNYCSDLDTYEEMYEYLEETFTFDIAKELIEEPGVVVINGRLSYQSVGWGSTLNWAKAHGVIVGRSGAIITYKFTVPVYSEENPPFEILVEYNYIQDKGWRINSPSRSLR